MKNIFNVLIVGVGGQGIVLASDILSLAAMNAGYDVKKSEIHGMSQRGGSVFSHVRFGQKVYSPLISKNDADVLISMEEMETLRWLDFVNKETRIIFVKTRILPQGIHSYPDGIELRLKNIFKNLITINPQEIYKENTEKKYINTYVLGILSHFVDFDKKSWENSIKDSVPGATFADNVKEFNRGRGALDDME